MRTFKFYIILEGNSTTTSFHQDEYLKGHPYRTETFAQGDENHFSTTDTIIKKEFLDDIRAFVYCESTTSKYWEDIHLPEPAYTTQESYLYDMRNGLVTAVISEGPGAETITKTNEYSNYGEWVWRLTKELVQGSDSGIVREVQYGYENGTGNLLFKKGRLIGEEDRSPIVYYDYDSYGNQTTITDARGYVTHIEYDSTYTLPKKTTFPETTGISHTERVITYDYRFSTPTETEDENGNRTHYEYDEFGRLTQINFPDGGQRVIEYQDKTLPRKIVTRVKEDIQGNFSETHAFFDGYGRKIEEITRGPHNQPIIMKWHYDLLGRNNRTEGPFYGALIEFNQSPPDFYPYIENRYDTRGRVFEIETFSEQLNQPLITEMSYNGLSTTAIDPDGCTKTTIKDYRGRITQVTEYLESKEIPTSYQYNAAGDLIEVMDALNNRTILCYDTLGRKRSMTDPDMGTWQYMYDKNGNLVHQTDPKDQNLWWAYDELNRPTLKTYSTSEPDVSYTYDNANISNGRGRLSCVSNSYAETIINEYDVMGRIKKVTKNIAGAPSPYTFMYEYDVGGKQTKRIYPDGFFVTYSYYPQCGLLNSVTGSDGVTYTTISEYDPLGKIKRINYGNGTFTEYQYESSSTRLTELITYSTSGEIANAIQHKKYTYSSAGDILSINDEKRWISYTYEYDTLHRLISERGLRGVSSYQQAAIIKNFEGEGPLHAPKSAEFNGTTYHFTYDGNGNMTEGPDFSTPDTVGWRTITYNADNMPTEITVSKAGTTTSANLGYDASAQRVRKTLSDGSEIFYVSDTFEVINGTETKYIYAGPLKVAVKSDEGTYYYHKDHLGSAVIMTNASGGACEEVTEYLPYGLMRTHGGEYVSEYKFTGQERDPEIGLYNYNARLYDPALGMFITPDSMVPNPLDPQMLNRYSYCRNNPVMFVDPSGHFFDPVTIGIIVGAAFGAYQGYQIADAKGVDPLGYMISGAVIGGLSGGVGGALAGTTLTGSIAAASSINSIGMKHLSGGMTDFTVSVGAFSYNFDQGEFGYLGKAGNSDLENFGYFLGSLANLGDIGRAFNNEGIIVHSDTSDMIGHTAITDKHYKTLIDFGPDAPPANNLFKYALRMVKGTNNYGVHGETITINNVNPQFVETIGNTICKIAPYQGLTVNCTNMASIGLLASGIPNIGLHPYLLHLQMVARHHGFLVEQYAYIFQNSL
ncbi:MAG: RHS repeat domain-containing protein [bacterium]